MGRWIVGTLIILTLLFAALFASSSADTRTQAPTTPSDDFSLGLIAAEPAR